jgi:glycosyltransferase involved in cell wall biosynthesis
MKVLIIIPAYNEEECIKGVVDNLIENYPQYDYVVVNDGSKDHTLQILEENKYSYINLPVNLGIGGGMQTGYLYALKNGYEIAVQMDGDGQHDARYLGMMEKTLCEKNADMVIGSRFIKKEGFQTSSIRRVGIGIFRFLSKFLFGKEITDATSGMRMSNKRTIELFVKDYPRDYPEPETVCRLLRKHFKVVEVPVMMRERESGVSSISMRKSVYYMVKVTLAILIERMR